MSEGTITNRTAQTLSVIFAIVIVIFAASGPLTEFIRWIIEITTADFEDLSRREKRILFKTHWLGAAHKSFENWVILPTGMKFGLPILFSFGIMLLSVKSWPTSIRWVLFAISSTVVSIWIIGILAVDGLAIPTAHTKDYYLFAALSIIGLILTRQYFGNFIVGFALFWLIYFFLRGWLPDWTGIFAGSQGTFAQSARSMVLNFWSQTGGMFGQPLQVVSGNVLIFIAFGAVLMASGAGTLLLKIANLATGRFTGGAAHAAVAASALFGTLSGSAISNVVSTGVMTIPVIKKSGFKPAFAAAVEAAASTGGQVMPPVMGVVAFFVAGQIGLEYRYIVMAAIIPAFFFYLGTFLTVCFEARKQGVGPISQEKLPPLNRTKKWQCLVFIIPLTTLSYFLFAQPSVLKAGFYGFLSATIAALVLFPEFRSKQRFFNAFAEAGRMSAMIVLIVAAIGLIVGLIQVSGFSGRLSLLLTQLADGPLFLTLIVLALGAIVLGMGLPPGATYFIIVIALSSGIEAVGIAPLTLHLFVVFFAVISTVTPPVALAAFAAAPIAGANPMATGFQAARLSLAGFLIPFVFVYHPAILYKLQDVFLWFGGERPTSNAMIDLSTVNWGDLAWIMLAFTIALWLLTSALTGYEKNELFIWERALRVIAGIGLIVPSFMIALPSLVLAFFLIIGHRSLKGEPAPIDTAS